MTAGPSIDPEAFLHDQLAQASPDLMRQLLQTFINTLLSAQADAVCGADYGTRTAERTNPGRCRAAAWVAHRPEHPDRRGARHLRGSGDAAAEPDGFGAGVHRPGAAGRQPTPGDRGAAGPRGPRVDQGDRTNTVRQRAFSDRIAELMRKYTNQQLTSAEVIAELIAMAQDISVEADRGRQFDPPLEIDELTFYDTVSLNESAVDVLGEGKLADIARDLVGIMRRDVRTDWTVREDVRAKLRTTIKRLLMRHGYPPDKQAAAVKSVIEQMEAMAPRMATEPIVKGSLE